MGPSTKNIRFFGPFFDLPTYPYPIFSLWNDYFSLAISDFNKPTYLPTQKSDILSGYPLSQFRSFQSWLLMLPLSSGQALPKKNESSPETIFIMENMVKKLTEELEKNCFVCS